MMNLGWDITEIQESKYKPFLTDNVVFQLEVGKIYSYVKRIYFLL